MVGTRGTVEAGPGERLDLVADRLGTAESRTVLVVDGGTLVGVIEPEDVARFLRERGTAGDGAASEPPSPPRPDLGDRKSTRLNSSHGYISYAVFCFNN